MSIYITGDIHGDASRLSTDIFPEQNEMTKEDYMIILGDFGLVWDYRGENKNEKYWLDWLENKPFTTLFIDGNHECVHKDTELLIDVGWVNIVEVCKNVNKYKVASVDLKTHKLYFDYVLGTVKKHEDKLIEVISSNFKQCVTLNHDVVVNGKKIKAKYLVNSDYRIEDFKFNIKNEGSRIELLNELIEILTTIIMDATVVNYSKYNPNSKKIRIQYHLKKPRKIVYIQNLLEDNNIKYTIRKAKDNSTFICIYGDDARILYSKINYKKEIPLYWKDMNEEQLRYFLNALINTDGTPVNNTIIWRTTSKNDIDIVSEICIKNNYDINVKILDDASGYIENCTQYNISIGKGKKLNCKIRTNIVEYNDDVYCVTTKDGTIITRYKMCPVVTGNCFNRLNAYPTEKWNGGNVNFIRPSVIHLKRGQVFNLQGKKFFTFGGAKSHDIRDGILEPDDPHIKKWKYDYNKLFRINGVSWWKEELPSQEEMDEGVLNLQKENDKIDYILTHCPPTSVLKQMDNSYGSDCLTDYLQNIKENVEYKKWLFGHMHINQNIPWENAIGLYEQVVRIL